MAASGGRYSQCVSFDADLGPINFIVVSFPSAPVPSAGFAVLTDLVAAGRVNVLDTEFVSRDADGKVQRLDAASVGLDEFSGADSHLIDDDDVAAAAESLAAGEVAAIVVYEELSFLPVIGAWGADGGTVLTEGPVLVDDLIDALDATDALEGN